MSNMYAMMLARQKVCGKNCKNRGILYCGKKLVSFQSRHVSFKKVFQKIIKMSFAFSFYEFF